MSEISAVCKFLGPYWLYIAHIIFDGIIFSYCTRNLRSGGPWLQWRSVFWLILSKIPGVFWVTSAAPRILAIRSFFLFPQGCLKWDLNKVISKEEVQTPIAVWRRCFLPHPIFPASNSRTHPTILLHLNSCNMTDNVRIAWHGLAFVQPLLHWKRNKCYVF